MSSRTTRTRTPSGKAAAGKAAPVKATPTRAKGATSKAPAKTAPTKTSKATPKPTPAAKPKARGRSTVKKHLTPEVVEDEAEEVDEEEAAKEEEDHGEEDDAEERSGVDITSDDDVSYVSVASNEDDDEEYQEAKAVEQAIKKATAGRKQVARKASTPESPKIRRSLKKGEVPVSQESPSPKKPKNTLARKPTFAVAPASTPSKKRTKESYSDEDSDEEASPAKKVRESTPTTSYEDEDIEMVEAPTPKRNRRGVQVVNKQVQTVPPLPRGSAAAKAAVVGTPRKVKGTKAPNSADAFFNPSDVDRSSDTYRRQSKLFTDALDESAEGGVAHVTEAMQDVHIEENLNEGILDFETPGALCDLLRDSYKSLPILQPCTIDTGSNIMSSALLHDHIIDGPYDVHPQALLDLVMFGHNSSEDDPFVINPARADPALARAYQYPNWRGYCLAANVNSLSPHRLICATVVVCVGCHIVQATQMSTTPIRMIKEFLGVPLRGELERAVAFYGTIFGREILGVQNFGAGVGENRQIGLVFRTFPDTPNKPNTGRSLGGMGASPAMLRKASTPKHTKAGPARSLLDMRDKTSWSAAENFAIWDAREYFGIDKDEGLQYSHEKVASLPRLDQDLEFGDLAILYHSVSTFDFVQPAGASSSDKPPAYNQADTVLSMNLYGAALVAKYGSKSI